MTAVIRHFGDTADAHRPAAVRLLLSLHHLRANLRSDLLLRRPATSAPSSPPSPSRSPSTGKLHTALSEGALRDTAADRPQAFDVLLDALARAGLITLTTDTFISKDDGRTIAYKKAALTHEGREAAATGALQPYDLLLPSTSEDTPAKSTRKHVGSRATGTNPRALHRSADNAPQETVHLYGNPLGVALRIEP